MLFGLSFVCCCLLLVWGFEDGGFGVWFREVFGLSLLFVEDDSDGDLFLVLLEVLYGGVVVEVVGL